MPDVGGNQAGLQRGFTSRGTPNSQNVQLVNGVNVGDPAAIGFSMNYYEPATFENVQVVTGAQDISMGTSGTLINMVTRSGTNAFHGAGFEYFRHSSYANVFRDLDGWLRGRLRGILRKRRGGRGQDGKPVEVGGDRGHGRGSGRRRARAESSFQASLSVGGCS